MGRRAIDTLHAEAATCKPTADRPEVQVCAGLPDLSTASLDGVLEKIDSVFLAEGTAVEDSPWRRGKKRAYRSYRMADVVVDARVELKSGLLKLSYSRPFRRCSDEVIAAVGDAFVADARTPALPGAEFPVAVDRVTPAYPSLAVRARAGGVVELIARIAAAGTVVDVGVALSTRRPRLGLEAAAVRAVEQWSFKPAYRDGQPVESLFPIVVDFYSSGDTATIAIDSPLFRDRQGAGR